MLRAATAQADVWSSWRSARVHAAALAEHQCRRRDAAWIIEQEFFDLEHFADLEDFLRKATLAAFGSSGLVAGAIIQTHPPAEQYAKYLEYREGSIRAHGTPVEENDDEVRWTKGGTAMLLSLIGRDQISVVFTGPGAAREFAMRERDEIPLVTDTMEIPSDTMTNVVEDLATATGGRGNASSPISDFDSRSAPSIGPADDATAAPGCIRN